MLISPQCRMGTRRARASLVLGWLGSDLSGLLPRRSFATLPPCGSNFIFFGPGDGHLFDQDHVDHDLCRTVCRFTPALRCKDDQLPYDMRAAV